MSIDYKFDKEYKEEYDNISKKYRDGFDRDAIEKKLGLINIELEITENKFKDNNDRIFKFAALIVSMVTFFLGFGKMKIVEKMDFLQYIIIIGCLVVFIIGANGIGKGQKEKEENIMKFEKLKIRKLVLENLLNNSENNNNDDIKDIKRFLGM